MSNSSFTSGRWLVGALFAVLLGSSAKAQQDPMYSMYMWNMMAIDPAYAGSADVLNVTALSRMQWVGIQGAPMTHSLSAHAPINRRSLGAGISAVNDRIGRTSTTSLFGDIAYRMHVSKKTRLAFGLKVGLNHAQIANTRVENTDPNDPTFLADMSGKLAPNFGFGMYLWSKKGYIGLSTPKLLRNYLSSTVEGRTVGYAHESPHAFLTAGYVFRLGTVKFKPALMVKASEGAPPSINLSANFFVMDRLCLGAAYRNGDSVTGILSVQVNDQWRMGYAYDLGTSTLSSRSNGSHELMLSYDPIFTRERVRSPRYF